MHSDSYTLPFRNILKVKTLTEDRSETKTEIPRAKVKLYTFADTRMAYLALWLFRVGRVRLRGRKCRAGSTRRFSGPARPSGTGQPVQ